MKREAKKLYEIFARYILILVSGLGNLYLFYKILTPITIGAVAEIASLFTLVTVDGIFIRFSQGFTISIVPACVAGAAFYLLFILLFSTADIKPKKRIEILLVSFLALFVLNIARILFLIFIIDKPYFGTAHWIIWNLVSTVLVVLIWIGIVKIYEIKKIPLYTDFMYLWNLMKKTNKSKRSKKN